MHVKYVGAPDLSEEQKVVVGLDSWVWRRFAEADRLGTPLYSDALRDLEDLVDAGRVVVPLAATVYFESQGWSYPVRKSVAEVASRLSKWKTFLPSTARARQELDKALRETFGRPLILGQPRPDVGWGSHFAFTGETQRLSLSGSREGIAAFIGTRGLATVQKQLESLESFGEFLVLAGPSSNAEREHLHDEYGYEPAIAWRTALERGSRHQRMQEAYLASADLQSRPDDLLNASELGVEINEIFNERVAAAGIAPWELFSEGPHRLSGLLDRMPSSVVRRAIIRRALADRNRAISVNDVGDADIYSEIVPASHIVVAEKAALRALRTPEVKAICATRVIGGRDLSGLKSMVDSLDTSSPSPSRT